MNESLTKTIKENRPNISLNSVKTYVSLLSNLMKKLDIDKVDELNDDAKILLFIKNTIQSRQTAKTLLSALLIYTKNENYREDMLKYSDEVNKSYSEKRTSEKRLKTGISSEKINEIYDACLKKVKSNPIHDNWIDYIIVCLVSGKFIAPRRSLDWVEMKIKNFDKTVDNYYDKKDGFFFFNKFKTVKYVNDNDKKVIIPTELKKIINKWIKQNTTEYLIFNNKNQAFTSSSFGKKLNTLFGENVSTDLLRSVYISNKFGNIAEKVEEMNDTMKKMGSSTSSALQYYIKNDIE